MSDKKESKAGETGAAPKKPPIMMIIIVVAVVAMAAMFVVGKQVSAKAKPSAKKVEHGPTMSLDEFLVNLADSGGDHFLKVTVALGLSKDKGKTPESLKEQTPMIRDAVLMSLSSKMRDDISSGGGRDKLKVDIKKKVNAALGEDDVQDVYFSNFVTQ